MRPMRRYGGTGLGRISRRLAELMDGSTATSDGVAGRGSTFELS